MTLHTDRLLVPARPSVRTLAARLRAPHASRSHPRPPLNVTLVLDRSGSMAGFKLALARAAAERALRLLRPDDRFALVAYDDRVDVLVGMTAATPESIHGAIDRLRRVEARGSTDLCAGWQHGCEQVVRGLVPERLGRCLLLTDGLANSGIVEPDPIVALAEAWQSRGVVTSTFGVGADFDEDLLQRLAHAARGHFYFIESARQIGDFLASELGESLEVVGRDVCLALRLPEGATLDVLSDQQVVPGRGQDAWRLVVGDLTSGESLDIALLVALPGGPLGSDLVLDGWVEDRDRAMAGCAGRVTWTSAPELEVANQPRNPEVDHLRARMEAARARRAAAALNKAGDYFGAARALRDAAAGIRLYAEGGLAILQVADDLDEHGVTLSMPVHALEQKRIHFAASSALKSRDARGRARRA